MCDCEMGLMYVIRCRCLRFGTIRTIKEWSYLFIMIIIETNENFLVRIVSCYRAVFVCVYRWTCTSVGVSDMDGLLCCVLHCPIVNWDPIVFIGIISTLSVSYVLLQILNICTEGNRPRFFSGRTWIKPRGFNWVLLKILKPWWF